VGRIYDRSGPTALVVTGSSIVSAVMWSITMLDETSSFWWVLAAHIILSIGLALLFTPLFTAGLEALPPALYSHGSAIVGTVQQLAGAAGIALFVTVMTTHSASLTGTGMAEVPATAAGIQTAFLYGAVISLVAVVASLFVRRPAAAEGGESA
jgi:DHA2 family lincomycin resistance protein-like MFS transporter